MAKERVVVFGGSGFIGSHLTAYLKKKGHFVRTVGTHFRPERAFLTDQADEMVSADLQNIDEVCNAIHGMDWVVHLAADMGGVGYFHAQNYKPFMRNMRMDLNVLEAMEKENVSRLFYASSACAYPTYLGQNEGQAPKLAEHMLYPAQSDQMYGWEKLMMLMLCGEASFDCRVGLLHTIFGEYQEVQGERTKFPGAIVRKVFESQKTEKPIEIWGNGKQIRTFLYIEDAIEKIYRVLSASKNHTPVNIGSAEEVTVLDVARMCCEIVGVEPVFSFNESQPSGVLARGCDNSKFESMYGYKDAFSTKEGFARLIAWMKV